ncbi:hypothetical protein Glove_504g4 [Diversispora epigaea]|uniref:Uncharacterized protein n=1 Tax=Diversispora epigaea TaxID=1348612 RepID=A0A397GKT5_9GLOM|nr:hypothetical protein Glove_504g4 [Diversispora epigaea]
MVINIDYDDCNSDNNNNVVFPELRSQRIRYYIERTPAQVGGARRIEVIGKELFPLLFVDKFSQKKLNISQKRKLNRQIYTETEWKIDREINHVRVTKPDEKNLKFTPNWYFENDKLKKYLKNGLKGAFNNLDTFKGLCNIMYQVIDRKEKEKGTQNLQYSEKFTIHGH